MLTVDEVAARLRETMQGYIGTTTITPMRLQALKNDLVKTLGEMAPPGSPLRISAADVRRMGYEVPAEVPDCATCEFRLGSIAPQPVQPDRVVVSFVPELGGAWTWYEANLTIGADDGSPPPVADAGPGPDEHDPPRDPSAGPSQA